MRSRQVQESVWTFRSQSHHTYNNPEHWCRITCSHAAESANVTVITGLLGTFRSGVFPNFNQTQSCWWRTNVGQPRSLRGHPATPCMFADVKSSQESGWFLAQSLLFCICFFMAHGSRKTDGAKRWIFFFFKSREGGETGTQSKNLFCSKE